MTLNPWVPVSIACSGRTRTLPLLSLAAALRVDTQRLEISLRVFLGLGEFAEFSGEFSQPLSTEYGRTDPLSTEYGSTDSLSTPPLSTEYERTNSPSVPSSVHSAQASDSEPALQRAVLNPPNSEFRTDRTASTDGTDRTENVLSTDSTDSTERFAGLFHSSGGDGPTARKARAPAVVAAFLADVLDAPTLLGTFERLAAEHAAHVLEDALARTLETPGARIVSTRGHLFVAIVRRLAAAAKDSPSPSQYAPPPTAP